MQNLAVLALLLVFSVNSFSQDKLKWYSFDEGSALAKKEGKHLIVDFYTDWCVWCKRMEENTYPDAKVAALLKKNFIFVKLNPEKEGTVNFQGQKFSNAQFAKAAGVSGYPALGYFSPKGEFINIVPGYQEPAKFIQVLQYYTDKKYMQLSMDDYMMYTYFKSLSEKEPKNAELNYIVAFINHKILKDSKAALNYYKLTVQYNPKFAEAYAGLSDIALENKNKKESDAYLKKAKDNGFKTAASQEEKVKELVRKYYKG